ncbi:MAG: hypothetical protein SGJ17_01395 [Hyphomicrobiales bacterium]|nr:hypothetical protein [Hyphomicrobiales bacterium]
MFDETICMDDTRDTAAAKSQAVCLARMLFFALDEAREIGATDCQILISQGIKDLRTLYRLNADDLNTPRFN